MIKKKILKAIENKNYADLKKLLEVMPPEDLYTLLSEISNFSNREVYEKYFKDAIEVIEDEATEDIEKIAAIVPTEKTYFETGVLKTFKSRIGWLMLLMVSATFTGSIITSFEAKLTVFPALIAFIPMLMNTAGNCSSQASVTIIRGLSLGDISFKDAFRVILKEIRVGVMCSISLSVLNFIKLWIVDYKLLNNFDSQKQVTEIAIVCLTLFLSVIIAKVIGAILPMAAKKIGLDPAVMASPFITTVIDTVTLIIYFSLSVIMLN